MTDDPTPDDTYDPGHGLNRPQVDRPDRRVPMGVQMARARREAQAEIARVKQMTDDGKDDTR